MLEVRSNITYSKTGSKIKNINLLLKVGQQSNQSFHGELEVCKKDIFLKRKQSHGQFESSKLKKHLPVQREKKVSEEAVEYFQK